MTCRQSESQIICWSEMAKTKVPKSLSFRCGPRKPLIRTSNYGKLMSCRASGRRQRCLEVPPDSMRSGRKIEKTVPLFPDCARLRTRMLPAVFANDAERKPQPEACSGVFLGRVKRFEQMFKVLRADSAAVVGDNNPDAPRSAAEYSWPGLTRSHKHPPGAIASTAFTIRFEKSCRNSPP